MARVLLTEDDLSVRTFVRRALQLDGHDVVEASDGAEALALLATDDFHCDLIVSDITMPEVDGITLACLAKTQRPDLAIILMTGFFNERERADHLDGVVLDILSKPFGLSDIRRAVSHAVENLTGAAAAAACPATQSAASAA